MSWGTVVDDVNMAVAADGGRVGSYGWCGGGRGGGGGR